MKIAVVGATGMAGSRLTLEALRRGHAVTAYSRRSRPMTASAYEIVFADAMSASAMDSVAREHDVLVLATRPQPGAEGDVVRTATTVLDAVHAWKRRVMIIGGAAPLRVADADRRAIDDPRYVPAEWRDIAQASIDQHAVFLRHPANGVYVSPSAQFEPGERTGHYIRGSDCILTNERGGSYVSAEDLAVAVLDEIEHPHPILRHFTVASPPPESGGRGPQARRAS